MRVLGRSKQYLKAIAKRCSAKNKSNQCNYAKGFLEAEVKIQALITRTSSNAVTRTRNRVVVVVGAFDIKRGRGTAAFNGSPVNISSKLANHAKKYLGLGIGQKHVCGHTVGRCAEWRSANSLVKTRSKIKNIRWTPAYFVDQIGNSDRLERGSIAPYCAICTGAFGLSN